MFYATLPSAPIFGLRREIDRLFEDTFNGAGAASPGWAPATDIRETDTALTVEMELPGVAPDAVEVMADKGVLTVKGRREAVRNDDSRNGESQNGRWHITERVHGAFQRAFQLPDNVEWGEIEATYSNGVLTVRLPKTPKAQPKKIAVVTK
jgi:HSP20 family protein